MRAYHSPFPVFLLVVRFSQELVKDVAHEGGKQASDCDKNRVVGHDFVDPHVAAGLRIRRDDRGYLRVGVQQLDALPAVDVDLVVEAQTCAVECGFEFQ